MKLLLANTTAVLVGLTAGSVAHALETQFGVGYSAEYNDNPARVAGSGVAEIIHRPTANLALSHEQSNLVADVSYRAYRTMHTKSEFSDDTTVEGTGRLTWLSSREVLKLEAANSESVRTLSALEQDTPENRQQVGQRSGSATLRLGSFANHFVTAEAKVELVDAGVSATNSTRYIQDVRYNIPLTNEGNLSFGATRTDVDFKEAGSPDYEVQALSMNLQSSLNKFIYGLAYSYNEVEREGGREDLDLNTGNFNLTWVRSESTSVSLELSREVNDNTLESPFASTGVNFRNEFIDNSELNEVFVQEQATLSFSTQLSRYQVTASASVSDLDYLDLDDRDEERRTASLRISRGLTPRLEASLQAYIKEFDFTGLDRTDDEVDVSLDFGYRANRKLNLGLNLGYYQRDQDITNLPNADGYAIIFTINYQILGQNSY